MRCLGTATAQSSCIWKEGSLPLADAIIKNHFELAVHWICRNCGKRRYQLVTFPLFSPFRNIFLPSAKRYTSAPPHELPKPAAQL